jgi:KipI family sensor histidine kinase inhibitor
MTDQRPGTTRPQRPTLRAFGEAAFMVDTGGGIDPEANALVQGIAAAISKIDDEGWGDPIPAYDSVLVSFDPERLVADEAERRLRVLVAGVAADSQRAGNGRQHRIPVRYGGADGPDLEAVAEQLGLTREQVVEAHTGVAYRVFVLGFAPGFAYLGPLPEVLRLPRRDAPRPRVPAGSVAIAGSQTAIYPTATPGGWHLIGRTETIIWDPHRAEPACFTAGDTVRFHPIRG